MGVGMANRVGAQSASTVKRNTRTVADKTPYQRGYKHGKTGDAWQGGLLKERLDCIAYHLGFTLGQKDRKKEEDAQAAAA